MKPVVTVLVDTYNHERFIEEALASVLGQDFPPEQMEILVVDDGSTDRTPEIVRKFAPRARLIRKENGGQASAFNAGILEAQGEIVAFLDGDDWWAADKLRRVVEAMAADPEVGIVGHGIIMVKRDGHNETEVLREGFRFQADTLEGARLFRLRRSLLGTSRMTIRTEVLRRIGPVPNSIVIEADEYLFTLAAALCVAKILPNPLAYYRLHDANLFLISTKDPENLRRKCASLSTLARCLGEKLASHSIDAKATRTITEIVQAEADQLRLLLDGGTPTETLRTEWTIYDVHNRDASLLRRALKWLSLIPALFIRPQKYYGLRARLLRNRTYREMRGRLNSSASQQHVLHEQVFGAGNSHAVARGEK
jgi:glycosyltransferase involved in cell wall biosynthesis